MVGAWVVTTALIVVGVDAAIERVARDVAMTRPAPLAPRDVDELLHERDDTVSTTTEPGPPATEATRVTSTSLVGSAPTGSPGGPEDPDVPGPNPSEGPERPGIPGPTPPGGQPDDAGTTTTPADKPGRPDVREGPRRP